MLAALHIRDIVLIDSLDLEFEDGLSVLTGETGAGKSIILDALTLALGGRADRALLRAGAKSGSVTARFLVPRDHRALALLEESGIPLEEGELLLRRQLTEDGRGRAFANGEPVSLGLLRDLGAQLVEIHGQHDGETLLDPVAHRAVLDGFGGLAVEAERLAGNYEAWRAAEAALSAHRDAVLAARRDADYIAHAADDLAVLAPRDGEETQLAMERAGFAQRAKTAEAIAEAQAQLMQGGGAGTRLAQALRRLERIAEKAGEAVNPARAALERALSETAEAEALLDALTRDQAFDPARLEKIEERLFALRAAARKFSSHADALGTLWSSFEARRAGLVDSAAEEKKLEHEAVRRRTAFADAAALLREKRMLAAKRLAAAVIRELKPLKLDKARFEIEVTPLEETQWGPGGTERVRFLVQTNPGTPMGPLSKIASGGERARFFLALKVVLAKDGEASTLIFDEVDQGVGGAVAAAVGERLARLAKSAQLLLVTHSPQIAARADHHFRIAKAPRRKGEPVLVTRIERLEEGARREEIARMLSGTEITNEARAAAEKLIGAKRAGASG